MLRRLKCKLQTQQWRGLAKSTTDVMPGYKESSSVGKLYDVPSVRHKRGDSLVYAWSHRQINHCWTDLWNMISALPENVSFSHYSGFVSVCFDGSFWYNLQGIHLTTSFVFHLKHLENRFTITVSTCILTKYQQPGCFPVWLFVWPSICLSVSWCRRHNRVDVPLLMQ